MPTSLAHSGEVADASAGQISVVTVGVATGAVEERREKTRFLLGGECFTEIVESPYYMAPEVLKKLWPGD
ncbi:hypothetical protein ABZP36_007081 [Zizania latifolia]